MTKQLAFNKQQFALIVNSVNKNNILNVDFCYDVYEVAFHAVANLKDQNIVRSAQPINSIYLIFYILGEYSYSVINKSKEEIDKFNNDDKIKIQMASVVADKYMSLDFFNYKETTLGNKYIPPISSLDTYLNFMLNTLNKTPKNNPRQTLINDLLNKSISIARCCLYLLTMGFETEALASWRTLHECECTLILLEKYRTPLVETYLRHMTYAIAFRSGLKTKEETDQMFVEIKDKMRQHDLKSKDMKKFIEYGWLYDTTESKDESFKLNFRDGLQKAVGLSKYSKVYEQSSEIVHSTPMLIYSNKPYYYHLTLIILYESFFRIEKIFKAYFFSNSFEKQMQQYENMQKIYFAQLTSIYKREVNAFSKLNNPSKND